MRPEARDPYAAAVESQDVELGDIEVRTAKDEAVKSK